ncbi:hypothetical protein PtB15_5B52 [Puccinia triticina]|nr:hypothetical protein PtB15_5B52 [Puccinia triticina]
MCIVQWSLPLASGEQGSAGQLCKSRFALSPDTRDLQQLARRTTKPAWSFPGNRPAHASGAVYAFGARACAAAWNGRRCWGPQGSFSSKDGSSAPVASTAKFGRPDRRAARARKKIADNLQQAET